MNKIMYVMVMAIVVTVLFVACSQSGNDTSETGYSTEPTEPSYARNQAEPPDEIASSQSSDVIASTWPSDENELAGLLSTEANTSARVDEIASLAKEFAASGNAEEERTRAAISYIQKTNPNFYSSNETMEYAMFLGHYLDCLYPDDLIQSGYGRRLLLQAQSYVRSRFLRLPSKERR